ncbi:hypothetical protein QUA82_35910, partial [Microcoleus sp. F8-D3]
WGSRWFKKCKIISFIGKITKSGCSPSFVAFLFPIALSPSKITPVSAAKSYGVWFVALDNPVLLL